MKSSAEAGFLSRWRYYLSSLATLWKGFRERGRVFGFLLVGSRGRSAPVTLTLRDGSRFRLRDRIDLWVLKETCLDRDYESEEVHARDGWTIFDVGAGFGDFAVSVARRFPSSVVYAFEPIPESFALLQQNAVLNDVGNVRAFPEAVDGRSGTLDLRVPEDRYGPTNATGTAREDPHRRVSVPAITLAAALDRAPGRRCDFLKMDIEGGEYAILLAAPKEVLDRVGQIAMEYHDGVTPHSHAELAARLTAHGFHVRERGSPAHRGLGYLYASRVAGPSDRAGTAGR